MRQSVGGTTCSPPLQSHHASACWPLVLGLACSVFQFHGEMKWFYTTTLATAFLHLLLSPAIIHRWPTSAPSGWGPDDEKMRLGSTPPSCHDRCSECNPCMAVQVPTPPDVEPGRGNSVSKAAASSSTGDPYSNYKPLEWKCQCGDHIFNP